MATRREALQALRALPFRDAYRVATGGAPFSWNSVTTGLAAMTFLWLVHGSLFFTEDIEASAVGLVLLPLGAVIVVRGWVYSRVLVMFLGIAAGSVGAAAPFWIINAA
ncbi:MAG: hypothetical protein ACXWW7_16890 [Nocardioides sp.]